MALTKVNSRLLRAGVYTASSAGFTGVGNEASKAKEYLDYCVDNKLEAVIDMDLNWDGLVYNRGGFTLTGPGFITGFVKITGFLHPEQLDPVTVGTPGNYALAVGSTIIPGNFSSYSPGDKVLITLVEGETAFNGSINQIGVHFATVASASSSSLVINEPVPFAFDRYTVGKVPFTKVSGVVPAETRTLSGDFSHLTVGQVCRIENTTGVDSVDGLVGYFEYVRVKAKSATSVTFMDPLVMTYGDPVISAGRFIDRVSIVNANIDILHLQCALYPHVSGCFMHRSINGWVHNGTYSDVTAIGNTPTIVNFTYPRSMTINGVSASGAQGTTDNSAYKMMGAINCTVDSVVVDDYGITSGSQSINGLYVDFLFTPYRGWCVGNVMNNLKAGKESGGLGAWFDGMRDSVIDGLVAGGHIRLYELEDSIVSNIISTNHIFTRNLVRCDIDRPHGMAMQNTGSVNIRIINPRMSGPATSNANRCMSVAGSTKTPISSDIRITGYVCDSTTPSDTALYFQNVSGIYIDGMVDKAGLTASVASGASITAPVQLSNHSLNNSIGIGGYTSIRRFSCDVGIGSGTASTDAPAAFDRRRLVFRDNYVFADAVNNIMRLKYGGAPSATDDGGIFGLRVPVPTGKMAAGKPGYWAIDDVYMYIWQNASMGWRRIVLEAAAAWT